MHRLWLLSFLVAIPTFSSADMCPTDTVAQLAGHFCTIGGVEFGFYGMYADLFHQSPPGPDSPVTGGLIDLSNSLTVTPHFSDGSVGFTVTGFPVLDAKVANVNEMLNANLLVGIYPSSTTALLSGAVSFNPQLSLHTRDGSNAVLIGSAAAALQVSDGYVAYTYETRKSQFGMTHLISTMTFPKNFTMALPQDGRPSYIWLIGEEQIVTDAGFDLNADSPSSVQLLSVSADFVVAPTVPEPTTLLLVLSGIPSVALARRRYSRLRFNACRNVGEIPIGVESKR